MEKGGKSTIDFLTKTCRYKKYIVTLPMKLSTKQTLNDFFTRLNIL